MVVVILAARSELSRCPATRCDCGEMAEGGWSRSLVICVGGERDGKRGCGAHVRQLRRMAMRVIVGLLDERQWTMVGKGSLRCRKVVLPAVGRKSRQLSLPFMSRHAGRAEKRVATSGERIELVRRRIWVCGRGFARVEASPTTQGAEGALCS